MGSNVARRSAASANQTIQPSSSEMREKRLLLRRRDVVATASISASVLKAQKILYPKDGH
jgi:hypothetical protein